MCSLRNFQATLYSPGTTPSFSTLTNPSADRSTYTHTELNYGSTSPPLESYKLNISPSTFPRIYNFYPFTIESRASNPTEQDCFVIIHTNVTELTTPGYPLLP